MLAIVRLVGTVGVTKKVADTMKMLRVNAANECSLAEDNASVKGMLQMCKDYCTWGEVDSATLAEMMRKRMRVKNSGENRVDEKNLKQFTDYSSFDALAKDVAEGKIKLRDYENVQQTFRLSPPSGGFGQMRDAFPRGESGNRGKEINTLLKRMM
jgi:large subunit ribosomal protein L30